jgi:hypothetical protein
MYEKQTSFQSGVSAAPQNMQQKNACFAPIAADVAFPN